MSHAPLPIRAARRRPRPLIGWLVVVGALLQLALFAYAVPDLAGTGDSRYYLHAAHTLRETGQLLNIDGTPYRFWPPLYPMLLAATGSLAGVRLLHGAALLGSLLLWGWLGRQLLPARRALLLPLLLALGTPGLLVGKFVWAECVFTLLAAAYAAVLLQWLRSARGEWMVMATVVGLLLPLQRTLGLFLLAGGGVALLLGSWRHLAARGRWLLLLHLSLSGLGGLLWQVYALFVVRAPSRYHPPRGWDQLLSSAADYGFVLGRWLLPLPASARGGVPEWMWAVGLLSLFVVLWPHRRPWRQTGALAPPVTPDAEAANTAFPATHGLSFSTQLLREALWAAAVALVALVAALTVFAQSAAGIHDAERYASVLFGPVVILVLAAWPARAPRWLGAGLLGLWLLALAFRVGHVAQDLRRVPPLPAGSFTGPAPHGQGVGAAGE
ncbi:hypothetical protein [Hymenobacter negativus]|uniref:Glycosyltransferase RgtA/B/C/D-like domain-containing protein n=1 Tax=Hymenobacter negativus TaxID=2795026 RepID=A0ABS0Q6H7_9BACT|nr:hypothetical protein [Hymenobacter negativus]MBH8557973.1 hypothetical protein [Hymenobacter negativus]